MTTIDDPFEILDRLPLSACTVRYTDARPTTNRLCPTDLSDHPGDDRRAIIVIPHTYTDESTDALSRSNQRMLLEHHGDQPWLVTITYPSMTTPRHELGVDPSCVRDAEQAEAVVAVLDGLADYPVVDDIDLACARGEIVTAEVDQWVMRDVLRRAGLESPADDGQPRRYVMARVVDAVDNPTDDDAVLDKANLFVSGRLLDDMAEHVQVMVDPSTKD